jgi:hypothetical protein
MKTKLTALFTLVVALGLVLFVGTAYAKKKSKHIDAHAATKQHLSKDGTHEIHKNGKHTASAEVKGGKIKSFHVKHATRGDIALRKVKSKSKVAMLDTNGPIAADTVVYAYDGYCYDDADDDNTEVCYWYPVEIVIDDFTGAVEYVAPM